MPTGSIAGVVFSDANGNGWATGATGYESLGTTDHPIENVTVSLYGCYDDDPASGGVLITSPTTNKDCDSQGGNSNWYLVETMTTAADGSYLFDGLLEGYYYTIVDDTTLPSGATQSAEAGSSDTNQNGTGHTCPTCDHTWGDTAVDLNTTNFNPVGTNEDITNVNFGYASVPATVYGLVFTDANGDGDQGTAEAGISGVEVRTLQRCDLFRDSTRDRSHRH